jgi:hypothetical protein
VRQRGSGTSTRDLRDDATAGRRYRGLTQGNPAAEYQCLAASAGNFTKGSVMKWETPAFVEINMSAEIGGYQSDDSTRDPWGPVAPRSDAPRADASAEPASRKTS